jgi:hypothetical protein
MRVCGRPHLIPAGWCDLVAVPGAGRPGFGSPRREEAAGPWRGDHAVVTMRRRSLRALQRIERDLAGSDPGLDALFRSFSRRTRGYDLSWVEKVDRRPCLLSRMFGRRRHERTLTERMKDWTADNWKDP